MRKLRLSKKNRPQYGVPAFAVWHYSMANWSNFEIRWMRTQIQWLRTRNRLEETLKEVSNADS